LLQQRFASSSDFLTDNVQGKVTSYVSYDSWGAPTMKAILKLGVRELDLVTEYTGHMYDPVLNIYYARARMYDAADRRFMAVDPIKGIITRPSTLSQYSYVVNNPLKYFDPFGLEYVIYDPAVGHYVYTTNRTVAEEHRKAGYWVTGLESSSTKDGV